MNDARKEAGRAFWDTANYAATQVNSPHSLHKQYLKFYMFEFMTNMFICEECRSHYPQHIQKVNRVYNYDQYVTNPETALYFVWLVHDSVNQTIPGAKRYSFEDTKKKYLTHCQSCSIPR